MAHRLPSSPLHNAAEDTYVGNLELSLRALDRLSDRVMTWVQTR